MLLADGGILWCLCTVLAGVDCVHKCRMERFHQSAKVKSGTVGMHFTFQSLFLFDDHEGRKFNHLQWCKVLKTSLYLSLFCILHRFFIDCLHCWQATQKSVFEISSHLILSPLHFVTWLNFYFPEPQSWSGMQRVPFIAAAVLILAQMHFGQRERRQ